MKTTIPEDDGAPVHDPYQALRFRDFRLLLLVTFFGSAIEGMLSVALGWELYERTGKALALGLVGLVQVVPVVLLALPAGQLADRRNRKQIAIATMLALAVGAGALTLLSAARGPLALIYATLFLMGIARAFQTPATSSLPAQVVPTESFGNAAAWESSAWQASSIVGPAFGGLLIALRESATLVYAINAGAMLLLAAALALVHLRPAQPLHEPASVSTLFAGLRFVMSTKIILAAITLDMFAVLFGGATALLPIFAKEILHVGASGLGLLRAAPALGAVAASLAMAHLPPLKRAGPILLTVVGSFGAATIVFGLSRSFPLSLAMLALLGVLDSVSVVIRSTLLLLRTPDAMRGRVNAIHFVFIGLSNELGAFESGVAAALLGAVGATVAGGVGTLLVVPLIALRWPEIRRLGRIDQDADGSPD